MTVLQAVDKQGKTYASYQIETKIDIKHIKEMAERDLLICPECQHPLLFRAGEKKIFHFAHKLNSACVYPYWEPETEQHIKGKLMIKEWMEKLYPHSQVRLEYKAEGTNQRTDVMVIHPNGVHLAIEFQCTSLSEEVWKERHTLYENAGVKDVWIYGDVLHKYGKQIKGKTLHLLRGGLYETYKKKKVMYYFDPLTKRIRLLYGFGEKEFEKEQVVDIPEYIPLLSHVFWWGGYIVTNHTKRLVQQQEKEMKEKQRWLEKRKERIKAMREEMRDLPHLFTEGEYKQFVELCKKHGITVQSIPGCFHVHVENVNRIKTPTYLWQLWIYDRFFYKKSKHLSNVLKSVIQEEFKKQVAGGVFRVGAGVSKAQYTEVVQEYLNVLERIRLIEKWKNLSKDTYAITASGIPIYDEKDTNLLVCLALEDKEACRKIDAVGQAYGRFMADMEKKRKMPAKRPVNMKKKPQESRAISVQIHPSSQKSKEEKTPFMKLAVKVYDVGVQYSQYLELEEVMWLVSVAQNQWKPKQEDEEKLRRIQKKLETALKTYIR